MALQKFRWSRVYESAEEELLHFLEDRNISAERTHLDEFGELSRSAGEESATIWCAEGSAQIKDGEESVSLQPGDGIKVSENTAFVLAAGFSGCVFYTSIG